MKVIVTGGAGFIGSHLVDALVERGDEVHIIDNLSGGKKENINAKATFHEKDITQYEDIAPIISGATYVFHLAALPRVQYSIEHPRETCVANVLGTVNVLLAAHEGGVKRVVYSASSSAYGNQDHMPLTEDMEPNPVSPYGLQKYEGELYCRMFNKIYELESVCLRYFNVYGSRFDPTGNYALVIGKFLQLRKEGKPLTVTGDGEQTRDFTHVRDVVRANLLAAESTNVGKGETINIGAGDNQTINKIAELIGGPVEHIAPRIEPHDTLADNTRAKELLGWESSVDIKEGIAELKKEYLD